ncbi:MAG: Swt1 family HEPN domain-containing protein [Acidimicrobiales bacterium]
MGTSYRAQVAVAFEILAEGLAPFVDARMSATFPGDDWILMAAGKLGKRRDVLVSLSDPHFQLEVMNRWWGPAFSSGLSDGDRARIGELRTSRNHWAHPDQDHPLDIDAALSVVQNGEELLRAIGSDEAERMADLQEQLRWDSVREVALEQGLTESEAVLQQLVELKEEHDELQRQLAAAREAAQSASGRSRAVSRQLAELQTQYAAVAGLRDQYLVLQRQLEEEREKREAVLGDTTTVRQQLDAAQAAISALQNQSSSLNDQLSQARRTLATIDPIDTEVGKRWLWLISALVMVLGILVVVAAYIPR